MLVPSGNLVNDLFITFLSFKWSPVSVRHCVHAELALATSMFCDAEEESLGSANMFIRKPTNPPNVINHHMVRWSSKITRYIYNVYIHIYVYTVYIYVLCCISTV